VVIRPDRPWEALMISFWVTVLEDNGRLRMWYICRDKRNRPNLAYAESHDGLHWIKPDLGIAEYDGSRANNLMDMPNLDGSVFIDPRAASPEEKYVYIVATGQHATVPGLVRHTSPDGLRWKQDSRALLPFRFDTQNVVFWDRRKQVYAFYLRGWDLTPGWDWRLRTVVRTEAASLEEPLPVRPSGKGDDPSRLPGKLPRVADELPRVLAADERDAENSDIYNLPAAAYPPDPRWYLGFPSIFKREKNLSDGRLHVEVAGSRDGVHWHRHRHRPYLSPEGPERENMVFIGPGMIVRGDEIWQYGTGFRSRHGEVQARKERTDGVIYRFIQRIDGFVSADFAPEGGNCLTAPVTVDGGRLLLNVGFPNGGEIRVGLCDPGGIPLPGFEETSCDPLSRDSTGVAVSWAGRKELAALTGREVRLSFRGTGAKLYSFRFEGMSSKPGK